jgi:hypothetical protein
MAEKIFIPGAVDAIMHVETDGEIHVEHVQDVEPILNYTHAARNHRFDAHSPEGFVAHVAEVPAVVLMEWAREAGVGIFSNEMSVIMEQKLRDPANAKFLAAPKLRDPHVIMKGLR